MPKTNDRVKILPAAGLDPQSTTGTILGSASKMGGLETFIVELDRAIWDDTQFWRAVVISSTALEVFYDYQD